MSVIIIAEAGVNHNGSLDTAKKLIDAASKAGVDYIKFQTFKTENLVSKNAKKADYQKNNLESNDDSQFSMLKNLELSHEDHFKLIEYCNSKNIKFFSTAFDLESIDFLATIDPDMWKVPSGEITNYPYLKKIAGYGKPIILSTGMSDMEDIKNAVTTIIKNGTPKERITVLHCNTEYPTPMEDVNLKAMNSIAQELGVKIGYSDHTLGIEVAIAAVAREACIIEKHFTLDRTMPGPDHKASLEPHELENMVNAIRNIEIALGSDIKISSDSEKKNKQIARKSIVAATTIRVGEVFTEENVTIKRPAGGISPMKWEEVIGKQAKKDFEPEEFIEL